MIFSYGVTNAGKSYTMFGSKGKDGIVKKTLLELMNIQNLLNDQININQK
jgi:hypothetical protein